MNNLPSQFADNNLANNQGTNFLVQYILNWVREKGGWIVENQMDSMTLEYLTAIDDLEQKKITIIFQKRKSSYRLSLLSKVQSQGIKGGTSSLLKMIENFNRTLVLQNNLYYFSQPNLFSVRSIIEKDSIQILQEAQLQLFFKKLFDNTNTQFILRLSEITETKYQQQYYSAGTKEIVGLIGLYKVQLANQVSRRNNQKFNQNSYIINKYYGLNPVLRTVEEAENEEKRQKLNSYLRKIKSEKSQTAKQINDTSKLLAHKIIMMKQKVDKNWKAPESSYGSLERVQAEYITVHSFNQIVSQQIQKQNRKKCQQSEKLNRNVLVRKNFKKNQKCSCCQKQINQDCKCFARLRSYETQIAVVSCIRNVVTENIASYFLQVNQNQQMKVQKFYSKYYPKCLSTQKCKAKQILPLILNLIEGMKILDNLSILHRDLKPDNILLDSKMIPKIIDFGSAWILNRTFLNQSNINLNQQLYTTKKYNLYFCDAVFGGRQKMNQAQFEQHKLYDMHAFGVIIKQIISDNQFASELGSQILKNLSWLSFKCSMHNPNQRLNHLEVQNFCSLLLKLWILKNQCFNK